MVFLKFKKVVKQYCKFFIFYFKKNMKIEEKFKNKWIGKEITNQTLLDLENLFLNLDESITPIVDIPESIDGLNNKINNSIPVKLTYNLEWEQIIVKVFFYLNNENQLTGKGDFTAQVEVVRNYIK